MPDCEILINLVDMKKHSYAQKITTSARFFYDFDPLESDGEWMVKNYYTMQVNLQISSKITILKKQVFLQEQLILEIKSAVSYLWKIKL